MAWLGAPRRALGAATAVTIVGPDLQASAECEPIIRALPEWFRDETSVRNYINGIDAQPTFKLYAEEGLAGFVTLKSHYPEAAEIVIFAVHPDHRGSGFGTRLLDTAEGWLRNSGCRYLQLKTLSDQASDEYFAATRAFYARRGFASLETLPTLWNEAYPCLIMVKRL